PMGHHALIGLPNLLGDEFKQRIALLPTAEKQVEELIDERAVLRQWKAREHRAGNLLNQSALVASADTLHDETVQAIRKADRIFQRDDAAEICDPLSVSPG